MLLQFSLARSAGVFLKINGKSVKIVLKTALLGDFFTSGPVVLSNATPDLHDTTYPGQTPHAQYARTGQACLPRTVQEISSYLPFFDSFLLLSF
jgi:hypothetical protein